jgi:hypothetical protein
VGVLARVVSGNLLSPILDCSFNTIWKDTNQTGHKIGGMLKKRTGA